MRQKFSHWIPMAFCAFLSLMALTLQIALGPDSSAWQPAFFCNLPLCFFFVGALTTQLQREIRDLQAQVAELQAASDSSESQSP